MNCARRPCVTWYCTAPTRKMSRPMAVPIGARPRGSRMPEAMKGAPSRKAMPRNASALSGRRLSSSKPDQMMSSSPRASGVAKTKNIEWIWSEASRKTFVNWWNCSCGNTRDKTPYSAPRAWATRSMLSPARVNILPAGTVRRRRSSHSAARMKPSASGRANTPCQAGMWPRNCMGSAIRTLAAIDTPMQARKAARVRLMGELRSATRKDSDMPSASSATTIGAASWGFMRGFYARPAWKPPDMALPVAMSVRRNNTDRQIENTFTANIKKYIY